MISDKIFKAYDVRGIYPGELNEEAAFAVGRAFAQIAGVAQVTVGRDMRLSSPSLFESLVNGITAEGVDVLDLGLVPVDAVYFAVGKLGHQAGIMITASHNPKDYNGFKMALSNLKWVRGVELKPIVDVLPPVDESRVRGKVSAYDIYPEYVAHVMSFVDTAKIKPLTVVVDAGNGMAGKVMPLIIPSLPCTIIPMNFELDGSFPAHPSNPLLPESQAGIIAKIAETKADFGVILDGDTDRLIFIDEQGQVISADTTLLLLAEYFLKQEPGATVVYNVICSRLVREQVAAWGGKTVRVPVGFVNTMSGMQQSGAIVAGELSSHYSFRDNANADSGIIALMILLQIISQDGRPLSQMVAPFQKYYKDPEYNITIQPGQASSIIAAVKQQFHDGQHDEMDGLTVEYADWWFNVRPSNTEPLLRLTIEADTPELLQQKKQLVIDFIQSQS